MLHSRTPAASRRPSAGEASHRSYGTELIEMDGGKSTGDDCEALAYHGYNGIERETVDRIKAWIVAARQIERQPRKLLSGSPFSMTLPTVSKCASRDWICCDRVWMSRKRRSNGVPRKIADVPAAL